MDFIRLIIQFTASLVFFGLNFLFVKMSMKYYFKIKNRKNESLVVSFWVSLAPLIGAVFSSYRYSGEISFILMNVVYISAVKYYYFFSIRKTMVSWGFWFAGIIAGGGLIILLS